MNIRSLKIGTRLDMGFGLVLLILVAMVVLTNVLNVKNKAVLLQGLNISETRAQQTSAMRRSMLETGIAMRNIGLQAEVGELEAEERKVNVERKKFQNAVLKLKSLGLDQSQTQLLKTIVTLDQESSLAFKAASARVMAFDTEGAVIIITKKINPLNQRTLILLDQLSEQQFTIAQKFLQISVDADHQLTVLLVILCAVAFAIVLVGAVVITRSIILPFGGAEIAP